MLYSLGKFFSTSFDLINDLRLHIGLSHFLALSWFLEWLDIDTRHSVEYAFFSMCLLMFAYLLNRYTDYEYDLVADRGLAKFPRKVYLVLAGIFLLIAIALCFTQKEYIALAFLAIAFGWFYSVPTFFRYALKHYFIVKNITAVGSKYTTAVAGAWVFSDISFPYLLLAGLNFFFIHLIYEILWDVRDIESDRVGRVKTIPNVWGKTVALLLCLVIAAVGFFFGWYIRDLSEAFIWKYSLTVAFVLLTFPIVLPRYFHAMIYGNLVLRFMFVNHEVVHYLRYFWRV